MEFNSNKAIFLQIRDTILERILSGDLKPGDRIPSVREYGATIGVNPNTVMRTYERLTSEGVIHNKRGIGYFISDEEVPVFIRKMELLGLKPEEIFNNK